MSQDSSAERFLLMGYALQFPVAFDLQGDPVWYYKDPTGQTLLFTRLVKGGTALLIANGPNSDGTAVGRTQQILREIDLAGNTVR